ncbi:hypothetical protein ACFE04_002066 [Oxalis oulophora]
MLRARERDLVRLRRILKLMKPFGGGGIEEKNYDDYGFITTAFTVYSSVMSLPEIALNKGYVCNLNPLCKCGYHFVLLTAYTKDNVGKRFFSCGSSKYMNLSYSYLRWIFLAGVISSCGLVIELIGCAKQLVIHFRTSCVDYETKLMASRNEVATQKETMQSMSEELAKTHVELDLLLKEKRQSMNLLGLR